MKNETLMIEYLQFYLFYVLSVCFIVCAGAVPVARTSIHSDGSGSGQWKLPVSAFCPAAASSSTGA